MSDVTKAIVSVQGVSKSFRLPHEKYTGLKQALINFRFGKKYEEQSVLSDVSFEIRAGEFFGIVGRNGSGKSTLLKLLSQIYVPNKGTIQINGSLTPFIELGVGFNPELTGRENVYLNGALLGFDRHQTDLMYDEIVDFAELNEFMDQKLKNYSSGMQVRLAFSVAIRAKSDILVLDEVLAVGDAAFQRKCYNYFMELKRNKQTVVLVTHDMGAVRQYCDRAIMIENGRIIETGTPEKVAQAYQKQFSDELPTESHKKESDTDSHWGTRKMRALAPNIKVHDSNVTLSCEFEAVEDVPAPILGFTIYGPLGNNILEGNTRREKHKTSSLKKGASIEIVWEVPNIFASGTYDVSVACCNQTATEFYDWFNHAGSFIVTKEGNTAGLVDPSLSIKKYDEVRES